MASQGVELPQAPRQHEPITLILRWLIGASAYIAEILNHLERRDWLARNNDYHGENHI